MFKLWNVWEENLWEPIFVGHMEELGFVCLRCTCVTNGDDILKGGVMLEKCVVPKEHETSFK